MRQDPSPRPAPGLAEIDAAVERVFADPALQRGLEPPPPAAGFRALVEAVVRWVVETWTAIADWFADLRVENPLGYGLAFALLLVVLALLLWHIGWTVKRAWLASTAAGGTASADGAGDERRSSGELRRQARLAAASGRVRDAVHLLVAGLGTLVAERRALAVRHSWTTRELLARLEERLGVRAGAGDLAAFRRAAEIAAYGAAEPDAAAFAALEELFDRIAAAVEAST